MKNYQVLQEALDRAALKGTFTLQEVDYVLAALRGIYADLESIPKLKEELSGYRKREAYAKSQERPDPTFLDNSAVGERPTVPVKQESDKRLKPPYNSDIAEGPVKSVTEV